MNNALLISINRKPAYVIPVHEEEFWTIDQILDHYCKKFDMTRSSITGQWVKAFDITQMESGLAKQIPPAKNEWIP